MIILQPNNGARPAVLARKHATLHRDAASLQGPGGMPLPGLATVATQQGPPCGQGIADGRPAASKLAVKRELRRYEQDRLAGVVRLP